MNSGGSFFFRQFFPCQAFEVWWASPIAQVIEEVLYVLLPKLNSVGKVEGEQNLSLENMPLWHKDYLKLVIS